MHSLARNWISYFEEKEFFITEEKEVKAIGEKIVNYLKKLTSSEITTEKLHKNFPSISIDTLKTILEEFKKSSVLHSKGNNVYVIDFDKLARVRII